MTQNRSNSNLSPSKSKRPNVNVALPGRLIVQTGKWVWSTMWHTMMSQIAPRSKSGAYLRPESQFRHWVRAKREDQELDSGNMSYLTEAGRYHLYVGMGCPWAHRTLVVRALKGLAESIPVTVVEPSVNDGGWVFEDQTQASARGCRTLKEFYRLAQTGYDGRSTVPVLWDSQTQTIVNNESAEIIEILNGEFDAIAQNPSLNLYPDALKPIIDDWNKKIYHAVNNGVYRCGFAQSQVAYDQACDQLFAMLDDIDTALTHQRYLCGPTVTLADVRLFTTLFRFDIVYYGLFKCNRRRIQDYANLGPYLRDMYQLPGVAETCDLDAVKRDYYGNLFPLNPGQIIPRGPDIDNLWDQHGRDLVGSQIPGV